MDTFFVCKNHDIFHADNENYEKLEKDIIEMQWRFLYGDIILLSIMQSKGSSFTELLDFGIATS